MGEQDEKVACGSAFFPGRRRGPAGPSAVEDDEVPLVRAHLEAGRVSPHRAEQVRGQPREKKLAGTRVLQVRGPDPWTTAAILLLTCSGLKGVGSDPRTPQNVLSYSCPLPSGFEEAFPDPLHRASYRFPPLECRVPFRSPGIVGRGTPIPRRRKRTRSRRETAALQGPRVVNRASPVFPEDTVEIRLFLRLTASSDAEGDPAAVLPQQFLPLDADRLCEGVDVGSGQEDIARRVAAAARASRAFEAKSVIVENFSGHGLFLRCSIRPVRKKKPSSKQGKKARGERRIRTFEG